MGKAGKRAAPTPAASKPAVQPKRQRKAGSNKDELPILSEDEKKKYKSQWENFRVVKPKTEAQEHDPKASSSSNAIELKETAEPKETSELKETAEPKETSELKETAEPKETSELDATAEPKETSELKETAEPKETSELKETETPEIKEHNAEVLSEEEWSFGTQEPTEDLNGFVEWLKQQGFELEYEMKLPKIDNYDSVDPSDVLGSAAKVMISRLTNLAPELMQQKVRSLPRTLSVGDFFSGTGAFSKVISETITALKDIFPDETIDLTAKHCFMSEVVQFKQKFLLEAFKGNDFDDCCLFSDATKVFTDERECLRHKGRTAPCSCEIPSELNIFGGGFSCKSFSKLNNEFESFKKALAEMMEESSSYVTFKSCNDALKFIELDMFLLENVDLEADSENLTLILKALSEAGFSCKTYKLISSDFAVPQRRVRIYILGFSNKRQPQIAFKNVDKMIDLFRLPCVDPDKFLLDDDDPAVMKELDRRRSVRARADQPKEPEKNQKKDTAGDKGTTEEKEKDQSKWQATHQELAEKRGIQWPLTVPDELSKSEWFSTLNAREQEVYLFVLNESTTLTQSGRQPIRFADIYHSANRTPVSAADVLPTILPGTKMIDLQSNAKRLLLGRELLALQGLDYDDGLLDKFSENQLSDLAGNAYTSTAFLTMFLAGLFELSFVTPSESEQEEEVSSFVTQLSQHSHNRGPN
ncbi:unnamed protein product [Cladocopium goreaui]|uniref:Uncharacterized protein n=1 Tax=Cladocopium goreaui TaxID=2562237 RepID=A0A9P1GD92_9DINO|nr:unnamed protein product [Cladocopium goreaui]